MQPSYSLAIIINEIDFNNSEHLTLLKETAALAASKQIEIHNELDLIDTKNSNQKDAVELIEELLEDLKDEAFLNTN